MYRNPHHLHGQDAAGPSSSSSVSSSSRGGGMSASSSLAAHNYEDRHRQHLYRDDADDDERSRYAFQQQQRQPLPPPLAPPRNPYFQSLPPPPQRSNGQPQAMLNPPSQQHLHEPYRRSGPSHAQQSSRYAQMDQLGPPPSAMVGGGGGGGGGGAPMRGRDLDRSSSSSRSSSIEFMGYSPTTAAAAGSTSATGAAPHPKFQLHLNPAPAPPKLPRLSQRPAPPSPPLRLCSYAAAPSSSFGPQSSMLPPHYPSPPQHHHSASSRLSYAPPPPPPLTSLPPLRHAHVDDRAYVVHDSSSSTNFSGDDEGRGTAPGASWQSRVPPSQGRAARTAAPMSGHSTGDEGDLPDGRTFMDDMFRRRERLEAQRRESELAAEREREKRERVRAEERMLSLERRRRQMELEAAEDVRRQEGAPGFKRSSDYYHGAGGYRRGSRSPPRAPGFEADLESEAEDWRRYRAAMHSSSNRSAASLGGRGPASQPQHPPAPPEAIDYPDRRVNPFISSFGAAGRKRSHESLVNGSPPAQKRLKEQPTQQQHDYGYEQHRQLPPPPPPHQRSQRWAAETRQRYSDAYGRGEWDGPPSAAPSHYAAAAGAAHDAGAPRRLVSPSHSMYNANGGAGAAYGSYGSTASTAHQATDQNPFRRSFDGELPGLARGAAAENARPRWSHDVLGGGARSGSGFPSDTSRHGGALHGHIHRGQLDGMQLPPHSRHGLPPLKKAPENDDDDDDDDISITRIVSQHPLPPLPVRNGVAMHWDRGAGEMDGAANGTASRHKATKREAEIKGEAEEPSSTQSSPGMGATMPSHKAPLRPLSPLNWLKGIQTPDEDGVSGASMPNGAASPNGSALSGAAASVVSDVLTTAGGGAIKKDESLLDLARSTKVSPVKGVKRRGRPPGSKNRAVATLKTRNATASPAPTLPPPSAPRGRPSRPQRAAAPQSFKDMYDRPFDSPKPIHAALPVPVSSRESRIAKNRPVVPAFRLEGPAVKLPEGKVPMYRALVAGIKVDEPSHFHLRTPPLAFKPLPPQPAAVVVVSAGVGEDAGKPGGGEEEKGGVELSEEALAEIKEEEEWERGFRERTQLRFEAVWEA